MKPITYPTTLSHAVRSSLAITLLASLCLCSPVLAKKGGGKPGGGGGDPPPDPAPFSYQLHWVEGGADETIYVFDVAADGTAAGNARLGADPADRRATAWFSDGSRLDLETLLDNAGQLLDGERVTAAFTASDGLLFGLDVYSGEILHAGALRLNANHSIASFQLFPNPVGGNAFIRDASETGQFLIVAGEVTGQGAITGEVSYYVWNTAEGSVTLLPEAASRISDTGTVLTSSFTLYDYVNEESILLPDPGRVVNYSNLAGDGSVVATLQGTHHKRDPSVLVRLSPGSATWQTITESSSPANANSAGEITGRTDAGQFIYRDDIGVQMLNDLVDPSQDPAALALWADAGNFNPHGIANPAAADSVGGIVWGRKYFEAGGNAYALLTPVSGP